MTNDNLGEMSGTKWPPRKHKRWATISSSVCFVLGALCILVFFIWNPTAGWGPSVLFMYGPLLLGIAGITFGIISQHRYLIVLNVLPPLAFPASMFFGTLLFGP